MNKIMALSIGLMGIALGTCIVANNSQKCGDIELVTTDYSQNPTHVVVHTVKPITAAMLQGKGVKPIEIAVTNHGSKAVTLTQKSVYVNCADPDRLSHKFYPENQYTSSSLLDGFALAVLVNVGCVHGFGFLGFIPQLTFGFCPGVIVASMYWSQLVEKNKQLTADFIRDLSAFAQKPIIVHPGQTVRRTLLLDNSAYIDAFTLSVYDSVGQASVARFNVYV